MNEQTQRGYDFAKGEIKSGYSNELGRTLENIARERELDEYDLGVKKALNEQSLDCQKKEQPQ